MARSAEQESCSAQLKTLSICVVIPTYNNERTIGRVVEEVLGYADNVIVVNDGSTDSTMDILSAFGTRITLIQYAKNKGKGYAMRQGFAKALELKFDHALTIDSDGQHYPSDIPKFVAAHQAHPRTFLMGSRDLNAQGMPSKNSFANKFSNFWFFIETGIRLPDTQTGFRLYPLKRVEKLWLFTNRFEFEVEVIVKLAWAGTPFLPVPIQVKYDPNERVSHFRPGPDFTRISFLNAYLCILTFLYYLPKRLLTGGKILKMIRDEALNPNESNLRKSASIGLGVFFGTLPIWGFQLLTGIPTAIFLRLNKVLFIAAANVSVPPMIPVIIYSSYKLGSLLIGGEALQFENISELSLANIHDNFVQYFLGGVLLALAGGLTSFLLSWGIFTVGRKKN